MADDPIDLSPLDPRDDSAAFERKIAAITSRAAPMLAERRRAPTVLSILPHWRRPIVAMAGLAAALAVVTLLRGGSASARTGTDSSASVAASLGVPTALTRTLNDLALPSPAELLSSGEIEP